MTMKLAGGIRLSDYSLVGKDSALAIEKGLVEAKWYTSPVPRRKMRELLQRRDGPAIRDTLIWFFLLGALGLSGYLLWGAWWAIIPFALYGVIYASSSDSRWHETSHGTAFKTDWMNNALYEIASFMVLRESAPWRWSHTRHHSDTIIVGRDPEIAVPRPANLWMIAASFINLPALRKYAHNVALHCIGRITPEEATFIPESEYGKVFARARIYALIYAGVFALAIATGSILPLMYIGLPSFYGAWLMVIYGLTQHAGLAENVLDHRLNCRTVYMNPISRYLYWNMNYHVEHHMFPLVPYHQLPKLHELVKADMPAPYNGLVEAYREIIPTVIRQVKDPAWHVKRKLPTPTNRAEAPSTAPVFSAAGKPVADGWVEVCASDRLQKEDVIRFDHAGRTFAIYRTGDGRLYATDGICTHGNAHLADGMVKGTIIECAKHNGRFDMRDGSPQRAPACVALKTYAVREREGRLIFDLNSAGGLGMTQPPKTYTFRVVSNDNVATFIKELALAPDSVSPKLTYQPGDYLQFDIPAYPERTLRDVDVKAPYAEVWQAQHVYDVVAANGAPCRRNYSFATNPAVDHLLRFNIRIAAPPRGQDCYAGVGSSHVFGLKPGDAVTAIGPFGDFHIKNTQREMVYLGGGAGMAPLRSHLAYLFETQKTARRVSYWYGARSLQEMFYQDYFAELARRNDNFSFHVALSEPLPGDQWTGRTGFIHEALRQDYLDKHPDPTAIEYYLCGPPLMIRAATDMLKEYGVPPAQIAYDEF
ncbi:MAG: NADH:ubiquinone reductase (Na(+)-transporting) subunit F [Chloroflexi bacterium]|nr:NADH:ubiquinone reductase (Na(+)-transporting) subunit F [Chloroflexota bacterium]MCL5274666.1 NADH:ubiquinone reductase (Na(+)-transporting) subunit F [Chloroflexota bacterium]